jgi:endonuclease III
MHRIDCALDAAYGTPEQELGNQADPLDEAVYIILSFQTDLPRLQATWKDLRAAYPTWRHLQRASLPAVASAIRAGGLQEQKASRIRSLLSAVEEQTGSLSLACLHHMNDSQAERVLTRLPGLSWKGARCVMLYSLGRPSFPVDGNTFRILKRTGVIAETAVYRRRELHDSLQRLIPAPRRRPVHVNLVVHGHKTCVPGVPYCPDCPLYKFCPRVGLPPEAPRSRRSTPRQPTRGAK